MGLIINAPGDDLQTRERMLLDLAANKTKNPDAPEQGCPNESPQSRIRTQRLLDNAAKLAVERAELDKMSDDDLLRELNA